MARLHAEVDEVAALAEEGRLDATEVNNLRRRWLFEPPARLLSYSVQLAVVAGRLRRARPSDPQVATLLGLAMLCRAAGGSSSDRIERGGPSRTFVPRCPARADSRARDLVRRGRGPQRV